MSGISTRTARRGPWVVGAAILALTGGSAVAVAQLSGSEAADPLQRPNAEITAAQPEQTASFAILRGEAGSPASLSAAAQALLDRSLTGDVGASPALARYALTGVDGHDRYVVPGRGWICLVSAIGRGGCNHNDQAVAGYGLGAYADGDATVLDGLVPDGVSSVEIAGAGGASAEVTAQANVWTARVTFTPTAVRWTDADGVLHDVPVGTVPRGPVGPPPGG